MDRRRVLGVLAALVTSPLLPVRIVSINAELRTIGMQMLSDGTFWKLKTVSHFTVRLSNGTVIRNLSHEAARPWFRRLMQEDPVNIFEKLGRWSEEALTHTAVLPKATGDIHVSSGKLPKF